MHVHAVDKAIIPWPFLHAPGIVKIQPCLIIIVGTLRGLDLLVAVKGNLTAVSPIDLCA